MIEFPYNSDQTRMKSVGGIMCDDLDAKIKEEFVLEFSELLEETEQCLFNFETNPDELETVSELFRLIHTLKGSCVIAGFNDLAEVVHLFESLLDKIRTGALKPDQRAIDVALKFTDVLNDSLSKLREDKLITVDVRAPQTWLEELFGESTQTDFQVGAGNADDGNFR